MCDRCETTSKFFNQSYNKTVEESAEDIIALMAEAETRGAIRAVELSVELSDVVLMSMDLPDSAKVLLLQRHSRRMTEFLEQAVSSGETIDSILDNFEPDLEEESEFAHDVAQVIAEGRV